MAKINRHHGIASSETERKVVFLRLIFVMLLVFTLTCVVIGVVTYLRVHKDSFANLSFGNKIHTQH